MEMESFCSEKWWNIVGGSNGKGAVIVMVPAVPSMPVYSRRFASVCVCAAFSRILIEENR